MKITAFDYILANRRASRMEEIEAHGHPVQSRRMVHKSQKVYDRNRVKRAGIKIDDGSFGIRKPSSLPVSHLGGGIVALYRRLVINV